MPDTSIAAQVDQLRQTILLLSAMLAALENKPINTYLGVNLAPAQEQWNQMLTEIAARAAPHDWVPWDTGVLASEAGSNTGVPRCWDTHRALLMAAERGDPVVDTRGMDPHVAAQMRI